MSKMRTIPYNRTAPVIDRVIRVRAFTLENGFSGKPVEDLARTKDFLKRTQVKISFDKATGSGHARFHSNAWYEFDTEVST